MLYEESDSEWNDWSTVSFRWDEEDDGVEWLTGEIVVDPDFNGVAYDFTSSVSEAEQTETRFYGDDKSASESSTSTTLSRDETAFWDLSLVGVSGGHTLLSSDISNGDGKSHSVSANADGSYEVRVDGTQATVGAEEWLDSIAP